jgi:D-alanyl-D-alanine carboxypeptidase (penicillin-binding protein 5/6)
MLKKISKTNLLILALILIINLFWPPTSSAWSYYRQHRLPSSTVQSLVDFQFPQSPVSQKPFNQNLSTQTYILIDPVTNQVIFSKNPHQKIYPASITKLATAITALNIYPLDELITISQEYTEGKVMELELNEKITVKSLVSSIIVFSANDAAFTLANHHPQGIPGFLNQMNLLAQKYNLKNTHFSNFDGIHGDNHYSTVYDLAQLGRLAIKNPIILENAKLEKLTVSDQDQQIFHELTTTNELLGKTPQLIGLKTGWTPEAGGCFIALFEIDGRQLISVVAQSTDRFGDTQKIITWSENNLTWNSYPKN